jgi:hypothetical protein
LPRRGLRRTVLEQAQMSKVRLEVWQRFTFGESGEYAPA